MMRKSTVGLIIILSLGLGYLSGRLFYSRKYDQVAAEMGLKKHTLWELDKQGNILGKMKDGKYKEAFEVDRELKAKKYLFKREFDKRMTKVKWAAWGIGAFVFLVFMLLGLCLVTWIIHKCR